MAHKQTSQMELTEIDACITLVHMVLGTIDTPRLSAQDP